MDFDLGSAADGLRDHLRRLIEEHLPESFLGAFTDDPDDLAFTQWFAKLLAAEGLLTAAWPEEFGGGGKSMWEQTVIREEMWAHHEPRGAQYMGLNWVGPALMRFGTPAQQRDHLPRIAAGDVIWCQGFSEPDAGSDLASLRTRAVPVEGGWSITGQKIWTSYAEMADWCFLAARSGDDEDRHRGITIFLVPMDREGVEVRPVESMLGPHHLNEVFFDDVRVDDDAVLGTVDGGWSVIRDTLAYERLGIARYARGDRLLTLLREHAGGVQGLPEGVRARFSRSMVRNRMARLMAYEVVDQQGRGEVDDAAAAAARIAAVRADQEGSEVLAEAIGPGMLDSGSDAEEYLHAAIEDYWRYSRAATIAAGALEIQQTIVARSELGRE